MAIALNKKLLWIIVVWFALLQTISPFIHAHIEADAPSQQHGLHMHDEGLLQVSGGQHALSAHPVHAVGVHAAVVEDTKALPIPLLAILFLSSLLVVTVNRTPANLFSPLFSQIHLLTRSRPRAPPLF